MKVVARYIDPIVLVVASVNRNLSLISVYMKDKEKMQELCSRKLQDAATRTTHAYPLSISPEDMVS